MKWSSTGWQLAKDVLLTGTGIAIIITQMFARQPSDVLLVVGLALTVPSAASHAGALLSGPSIPEPGPGSPSPSSPPPSSPSSSSASPPPPGSPDGSGD